MTTVLNKLTNITFELVRGENIIRPARQSPLLLLFPLRVIKLASRGVGQRVTRRGWVRIQGQE